MTLKDELPRSVGAQYYLLGERGEIPTERMKGLSPSGNDTHCGCIWW